MKPFSFAAQRLTPVCTFCGFDYRLAHETSEKLPFFSKYMIMSKISA